MLRLWLPLLFAVLLTACVSAPIAVPPVSPTYVIDDPETTALGRLFAPETDRHAESSGFLLLDKGKESLLWRGALAARAQRSIDVQYFIWYQDKVGVLAAARLLQAADRGVRVRVLVDDAAIDADPRHLLLLDRHPHIDIKIYNPFASRAQISFARLFELLGDFTRLNRRMHNKLFAVDGSVAIVGGRNVADEYYDLDETFNFRDRDILAVGPIVENMGQSFDAYWNSEWSVPVPALVSLPVTDEEEKAFFEGLRAHAQDPAYFPSTYQERLADMVSGIDRLPEQLVWGPARLIYDIPGKNEDVERLDAFGRSGAALTKIALTTERELVAQTPYLILMPGTVDVIRRLRSRGVTVRVMTNSLASTDSELVFAAYAKQRRALLGEGVELFEFRPDAASQRHFIDNSDRLDPDVIYCLHAKTAVFDRRRVYIGSFNMDPRSTHLNTEMGILVDSPELAEQVLAAFAADFHEDSSWKLSLTLDDRVAWDSAEEPAPVAYPGDPKAGAWRSFKAFLFSLFPYKSIL
ncbi:MAG: phospholipase D family protein [Rhodospirillales bacterium]|nr:phospholipase D family protein [Rhodospirillales bacterium]